MSYLNVSKGVTLIELLVIIAILGIFSGIGYVSFSSIDSGSSFRSNKEIIKSYLEQIRFKAFSDGKHYKVKLDNSGNNMELKLYEPDASNIKWRDLNLNRRCDCWSGTGNPDTSCNNAFSNSDISSLTEIDSFSKGLNKININKCNDSSCTTAINPPVYLCFLYDGSSPKDQFFKITDNNNLNLIIKLNKTGYVEN